MNLDDYLTTGQAAKELDYSHETVSRLAKRGKIKAVKVGNSWIIPKDEIAKYQRTPRGHPKR